MAGLRTYLEKQHMSFGSNPCERRKMPRNFYLPHTQAVAFAPPVPAKVQDRTQPTQGSGGFVPAYNYGSQPRPKEEPWHRIVAPWEDPELPW
jgi:hypothetical protein